MASPGLLNLDLRIGDTETVTVNFVDSTGAAINITGRTYTAMVRPTASSPTVLATFTCTVTDGPGGVVVCTLAATTTAALAVQSAVWDLQETSGTTVSTVLAGAVTISQDVTR